MERSFKKAIEILYLAKKEDVEIVLNEGRLQLKIAEKKKIDEKLLEEIRNNKEIIIDFLSNDEWKSASVTANYNRITQFSRKDILKIPLSFSQERLWFIDQLEGSVQYHSPILLRLKGQLDKDALAYALQTIVSRHEVLSTVFREDVGNVYQSPRVQNDWKLSFVDGAFFKEDQKELQLYAESLIRQPFDLANDYMLRATLISLAQHDHLLVVTMHHIASDAWSLSILVNEVVELYAAYVAQRPPVLQELDLQYADYSVWQRNYLQKDVLDNKLNYWKQKLDAVVPVKLPTDFERPAVSSIRGASASFSINKELSDGLQQLSQQQGATLFMTLLAIFKVLLYRYSGQADITVGTSIANRPQQEVEGLVGFFVNTLALRSNVDSSLDFVEFLQQVRTTTMEAYDHQDVPFEKVVEAVVKERESGRSSLFQVMLVLQNTGETPELKLGDLTLSTLSYEHVTSKFDFTIFLNETPRGIHGSLEYSTDLYKAETIAIMMEHYNELINSVVKNPHQKIGQLQMVAMVEQQQLLHHFNTAVVNYPKDISVIDLFEEQVKKTPTAPAIIFENEQLTYHELNERSNQLARYLLSNGVKENELVPLYMERGMEMMVGMLGILKAGGAYVPIDTSFPRERINYMLQNTGAAIIVSDSNSSSKLEQEAGVIIIETDKTGTQLKDNLAIKISAEQLAYVIYTSGSTGKPKGVMIEHRSLVDYYYGLNQSLQIEQCKSFALVSTIATDLGNTVIYSSLLSGGALHLFTKESIGNIQYLHNYFTKHTIDCLKIVPSHWTALSPDDNLLLPEKLLIFGGEALQSQIVEKIIMQGNNCRIINHYGPTETTIGKLIHEVKVGNIYNKTIPIGKPFSNTSIFILSKDLQLCPIGVAGQLYIAGDGLARGYYNNAALTAEKFIPNPYKNDGTRMYATGDLVKYLNDGNVSFIGRVDDQVKIRGYRIELGEIETVMYESKQVSEVVVLAINDKQNNPRLVAYIVPKGSFEKDELLAELKEKLPEYMVPSILINLDSFPLTANGKIDKKALPHPDTVELITGQYVAPRNELEEKLAAIWQDVLEVDQVGIHDDFFELGGHSLLAVRLVASIRKALEIELPLNDVFIFPTIAALATNLSKLNSPSLQSAIQKIKYLVPLKTNGNKIPLYIICGGGGTARRFRKFADMMDDDQPVYVLQPIVDHKDVRQMGSMEEIAEKFIAEIFINNPDGPFALSGHCVGGIIAFEMARQLQEKGKTVHMLAMFDTIIRKVEKGEAGSLANFYNIPFTVKRFMAKAILKFNFETFLLRKHTRKAIGYKMKSFKTLMKKLNKRETNLEQLEYVGLEIFDESSEVYRAATRNYKILPYDGEILLFYAKERYYFTDVHNNIRFKKIFLNDITKNMWRQYATSVTIYEVEGDHSDIFEITHGTEFARLLQQQLNREVAIV